MIFLGFDSILVTVINSLSILLVLYLKNKRIIRVYRIKYMQYYKLIIEQREMQPFMNQYCYQMVWIPSMPCSLNGFQVNNFSNFYLSAPQTFLGQIPQQSSNLLTEIRNESLNEATERKEEQIQIKQKQSKDTLNEGKTEEQNQKEKLMKKLANRPKTYLTERQIYLKNQEMGCIDTKDRPVRAKIAKTSYIGQPQKPKQIIQEEEKDKQSKVKSPKKTVPCQKTMSKKQKKFMKKSHKNKEVLDSAIIPFKLISFEEWTEYKNEKQMDLLSRKTNFI